MFLRPFVLAVAMTIAGSSPAPAQTQARPGYDPSEKVCLAKKRVCATRSEWEEKRRLDREAVEQAQRQIGGPCTTVGNKNTGAPSC